VIITGTLGGNSQHTVLIVVPAIVSGQTPTAIATGTQPEQTLTPIATETQPAETLTPVATATSVSETAVATETQPEATLTPIAAVTLVAQTTTEVAQVTTATNTGSASATKTPLTLRGLPNTGSGSSSDDGRTTSDPIAMILLGMALVGILSAAAIARKQHWFDSRS